MMRFPRFRRRNRRNLAGKDASPTWQDNMPAWDGRPGPGRYLHIPEIDRWRAIPYDMPPCPERSAVLQRVRQMTESLDGAIDEGTGASLDRLIESWTGAWIAGVETDYTDHCGVIQVHRGQALEWLTESTRTAEHEREEHDRLRDDYLDCRERLSGRAGGTEAPTPGDDPAAAPGWADPHLVAGRSIAGLAIGAVLVLAGALTDTVAFKNILTLVLRQESETVAWLMAAGATSIALVAAGSLGVALAIHRRRRRTPRLTLIGSAAVWLGLGLTMFLVRWLDSPAGAGPTISGIPAQGQGQSSGWVALFFAAIYLISGTCTMFEAERLYNPEYFAFIRLRKQYRAQAALVAAADGTVDRARTAVELHDGELDREDHRRVAAIADRQALGAEAANYARILMAGMLKDPAKTGLTETGPVPQMPPPPPGTGPEADDEPGHEGVPDAA